MDSINEYEDLVADATKVVEFKLVRTRDDVYNPKSSFSPLMAHQIFGDSENIFGYRNLKVKIMYMAGSLQIYLGIEYSSRIEDNTSTNTKADDIIKAIALKLPDGCYYTSLDEFLKILDNTNNNKFRPLGTKLHEFTVHDEEECERHFEIYMCNHEVAKFRSYFGRLQTFVLWFVDAAMYVDVDDPQWNYFICFEKYKNSDGDLEYASVGYTTVYQYYAWPEHIRPRISQMLVLPPFQKLGIGTSFIETIYQYFKGDKSVVDITVEDPSDDFQRIRNFVDSKLCKNLDAFQKEIIIKGFTKEMIAEAKDKLKINPRQCRKVYEILRFYHTNINDSEELKKYRLDIKKRLNINYFKQLRDIKKMQKAGVDTQWMSATVPSMDERLQQLKAEYETVEEEYQKVVEKLKS